MHDAHANANAMQCYHAGTREESEDVRLASALYHRQHSSTAAAKPSWNLSLEPHCSDVVDDPMHFIHTTTTLTTLHIRQCGRMVSAVMDAVIVISVAFGVGIAVLSPDADHGRMA